MRRPTAKATEEAFTPAAGPCGNLRSFVAPPFLKIRELSKEPRSKLRGISEVAVDRRATVSGPALGDRGLPQKPKQASENLTQEINRKT